ncbi:hypothetical protein MKW94_000082, partial [Papaver nudicaule]|nr:hypothetical protein [Papaver nudicaule]
DSIIKGVSASIGKKRKNVERTERSREPKSLTKSREAVYETGNHSNCSKRRKMVTFVEETRIQPEPPTNDTYDSDTIINGGSASIRTKRKNVQRTEGSREPVVELESLEHYKRKCIDLSVELGKKKEECTILQGKLVE